MTKQQRHPDPSYKRLGWFVLAALALLITGILQQEIPDWREAALLSWVTCSGVYLVYRFNDFMDHQPEFKLNLKKFLSAPFHIILLLQFLVLVVPLSIWLLSPLTFLYLAIAACIGFIYSLRLGSGKRIRRIKNVFLVKNILIGLVWACLILIGFGEIPTQQVWQLFAFVSLQVFIGSMIRDVPDTEQDRIEGVRSMPVVTGIPSTLVFMKLINVASFALVFAIQPISYSITLLFGTTVFWRLINLHFLNRNPHSVFWSQQFNLLTCLIIGLIQICLYLYSLN